MKLHGKSPTQPVPHRAKQVPQYVHATIVAAGQGGQSNQQSNVFLCSGEGGPNVHIGKKREWPAGTTKGLMKEAQALRNRS